MSLSGWWLFGKWKSFFYRHFSRLTSLYATYSRANDKFLHKALSFIIGIYWISAWTGPQSHPKNVKVECPAEDAKKMRTQVGMFYLFCPLFPKFLSMFFILQSNKFFDFIWTNVIDTMKVCGGEGFVSHEFIAFEGISTNRITLKAHKELSQNFHWLISCGLFHNLTGFLGLKSWSFMKNVSFDDFFDCKLLAFRQSSLFSQADSLFLSW